MSRMHNPPHPGETLREDILPALGLNVTQAAAQLGVTRAALSRVLNGRAAISPEMALRLEGWLGVKNGGRADLWVAQQAAYDLWQARKAGVPRVRRAVLVEARAIATVEPGVAEVAIERGRAAGEPFLELFPQLRVVGVRRHAPSVLRGQ